MLVAGAVILSREGAFGAWGIAAINSTDTTTTTTTTTTLMVMAVAERRLQAVVLPLDMAVETASSGVKAV